MREPPCRFFALSDAMVLVAATASGRGWFHGDRVVAGYGPARRLESDSLLNRYPVVTDPFLRLSTRALARYEHVSSDACIRVRVSTIIGSALIKIIDG
jgi:hypothetical protein